MGDYEKVLMILTILLLVLATTEGGYAEYQQDDPNISIEEQYPLYPSGIYMVSGGRVLRRTQRGWAAAYPVPVPDANYQQNKE